MRLSILFVWSGLFVSGAALGGDLDPPPGPIAPTDRVTINTQDVALPIVIDAPGSYVLTGPVLDCLECDDLATSGVVISASDVTLDCNGFQIVGDPQNSVFGIEVDPAASNVVIRDATVRDWSSHGISGSHGVTLERVRVIGNGFVGGFLGAGIELGSNARVIDCVCENNASRGISVGFGALVEGCTSTGNGGAGIQTAIGALTNGSVVIGCVSRNNGGTGFLLGDGTMASDCAASQNGAGGFALGPGASAGSCAAVLNTGDGFNATNALVHGCSAAWNTDDDIALSAGAQAIDSHDGP